MSSGNNFAGIRLGQLKNCRSVCSRRGMISLLVVAALAWLPAGARSEEPRTGRAVTYVNDKVAEGPWSVHVLKVDRSNPEYELHTMLANGVISGMSTLSEQVKALPADLGRPIAAINGDF